MYMSICLYIYIYIRRGDPPPSLPPFSGELAGAAAPPARLALSHGRAARVGMGEPPHVPSQNADYHMTRTIVLSLVRSLACARVRKAQKVP